MQHATPGDKFGSLFPYNDVFSCDDHLPTNHTMMFVVVMIITKTKSQVLLIILQAWPEKKSCEIEAPASIRDSREGRGGEGHVFIHINNYYELMSRMTKVVETLARILHKQVIAILHRARILLTLPESIRRKYRLMLGKTVLYSQLSGPLLLSVIPPNSQGPQCRPTTTRKTSVSHGCQHRR